MPSKIELGVKPPAPLASGLVVGGLLAYVDDGRRHSTVVHVHGGLGGIFTNADGDMVQTCIDWAQRYGRTAFARDRHDPGQFADLFFVARRDASARFLNPEREQRGCDATIGPDG